jgi:hypothetical protein
MTAPPTKDEIRGSRDMALFFPPVSDIRVVLYLALPTAMCVMAAGFAWVNEWTTMMRMAAGFGSLLVLANWVFFLRAATSESKLPVTLPDHYEGWSVPIRFQPEIRWQAIKLAIRSVAGLAILLTTMTLIGVATEGTGEALNMLTTAGPRYALGLLGGVFIFTPPLALMLSRYGLHKSGRRERDGGLPKSLIRRREAAIEALRRKWPDAVPREP